MCTRNALLRPPEEARSRNGGAITGGDQRMQPEIDADCVWRGRLRRELFLDNKGDEVTPGAVPRDGYARRFPSKAARPPNLQWVAHLRQPNGLAVPVEGHRHVGSRL